MILHPAVSSSSSSSAFFAFLYHLPPDEMEEKRNSLGLFLDRILPNENERTIINAEML